MLKYLVFAIFFGFSMPSFASSEPECAEGFIIDIKKGISMLMAPGYPELRLDYATELVTPVMDEIASKNLGGVAKIEAIHKAIAVIEAERPLKAPTIGGISYDLESAEAVREVSAIDAAIKYLRHCARIVMLYDQA